MIKATMILKSEAVFTAKAGDEKPFKGFVAIKDNKILAVKREEEGETGRYTGPDTIVYNCGNQLIMPGFFDAHIHFLVAAATKSKYVCTSIAGSTSAESCVEMVREFAAANKDQQRIIAYGWYAPLWKEEKKLHKAMLDAVIPNKPVYLYALDGHSFWLNSKALEECGIGADSEVEFGYIEKDMQGNPTGYLVEMEACGIAEAHSIFNFPMEVITELSIDVFSVMSSLGITSAADLSNMPKPPQNHRFYEILKNLEQKGSLPVRMHLFPSLGTSADLGFAEKLRSEYHSQKVRVAGLKQFVDGIAGTYTAYMLEPYADRPDIRGTLNYPANMYKNVIAEANRLGFGVRLHTLGDGAVRVGLDAFAHSREVNGQMEVRNVLEHCENIHPEDIVRFAEEEVAYSAQPSHIPLDHNEKVIKTGRERADFSWPFHSVLKNGGTLAFGTDYPVTELNPFEGIHAAVTRCNPDGSPACVNMQERITLSEALRAYTYGSAYCCGCEESLGTLEEGKLADLIVLNRNLFQLPVSEIPKCTVAMTLCNGEVVYEKAFEREYEKEEELA